MSRNFIALIIALIILAFPILLGMTSPDTVALPILMYHHIAEADNADCVVSADTFAIHLKLLSEDGYESVTPRQLVDFVTDGTPLPEKPYLIVFDDGYESNLELALPLLSEYDEHAIICFIGSSMGRRTYKDTDSAIIPHFGIGGARKLIDSGHITLGSHTWDMHMYAPLESGRIREYAVRCADETEEQFALAFYADCTKMRDFMRDELGCAMTVFAYPHGVWDYESERILREFGVAITLTTEPRMNILRRGDSESLYLLGRFNICETTDLKFLLESDFGGIK